VGAAQTRNMTGPAGRQIGVMQTVKTVDSKWAGAIRFYSGLINV